MFGVLTRVKAIKNQTRTLVQLNLELAKLEAKQKATAVGIAGGLAVGALVLVVYAIGFVFATIAAGLSEALSLWLSLLIVAVMLFLLAALLGYLAMRFVRKASPPTPTQAIEEATPETEATAGERNGWAGVSVVPTSWNRAGKPNPTTPPIVSLPAR